jgi:hypothetical protein
MSEAIRASRLPLLKTLKDLARSGATLDASVITTYAFNGLFYEEVLLRAFERAGSRLNIVLADAGQLTESLADPLRRPHRAGIDYLLAPIAHIGAFHPKLVVLLSEHQPVLALGSHNVTDAGFSHNEEVTAFWGREHPAPPGVLGAALAYALQWLEAAGSVPAQIQTEITDRLWALAPPAPSAANDEMGLIVSAVTAPLWDQLTPKVVSPARRVTVVGPYFDAGMEFFAAIERDLVPSEIIIAIQPDTAVLPRPDLAPKTARFVDASHLGAFWSTADEVGFAHGKALAIESEGGVVVSFGSANPTGAAWLAKSRWNAEANLLLTGEAAAKAFVALGLDRLADAPALSPPQLVEISHRSQALRNQVRGMAEAVGPPPILGQVVDGGVLLKDFEVSGHGPFAWVDGCVSRPVAITVTTEGSLVSLGDHAVGCGLFELRSGEVAVAFVVVNDAHALRAAALPRDSARILDHLGSLDNGAGFTDLLDLLDKHILAPADGSIGASRATKLGTPSGALEGSDVPFGPRGVSLPVEAELGLRRSRLSEGLIADIIAALIRALGAPPPVPATDGDAPDLDEGDTDDAPSSDDLARNLDAGGDTPDIDWPRLVTACRKRLTVMLKRLEARLGEAATADLPPSWALGRLVVVLSLLHRLRVHPPQTRDAISGRARPTSLVSHDQLATAFAVAVRALYGPGKLAVKLETGPDSRAAEERRLIDNLLLWFAREIGADFLHQPHEQVGVEHLQARADLAPVVMSAAAYETLETWATQRDPWLGLWEDAAAVPEDWIERHIAYGLLLQRLRGAPHAADARSPVVGDVVRWAGELDLPWVVSSISGHKMSLTEPAGVRGAEKRVLSASVSLLDISTVGKGNPPESPNCALQLVNERALGNRAFC